MPLTWGLPGRISRRRQGFPAIPDDVLKPLAHEFRHAVLAGLASVPRVPGPKNSTKQRPGRELLEFCRARRDDVLRFTTDTSIWPTNNISERGVRPLKTQQKISGRLASDDVTQDRLDIRSYIDTARKHGKNAMDILHDLMLGRPWRPRYRHSPRNLSRNPGYLSPCVNGAECLPLRCSRCRVDCPSDTPLGTRWRRDRSALPHLGVFI